MRTLFGKQPKVEHEPELQRKKLPSLFDFLNDLSTDKNYILDDENVKAFTPFMVNRAFSQYPDCVLLANEMNKAPHLSKQQVYDFYFYGLPSRKRRSKWAKASKEREEHVKMLVAYYQVNKRTAESYCGQLTTEQLEVIKQKMNKGGVSKK